MTQDKYVVVKISDAMAYLTPEERGAFLVHIKKINAARAERKLRVNRYVVLNAADPFARTAIEGYVAAAERSDAYLKEQTVAGGVGGKLQAIIDKFRDILMASRTLDTEQNPD